MERRKAKVGNWALQRGSSAAELAVVLVVFVPLLIVIVYAVSEASWAYLIKSNLDEAARKAARQLAIDYGQDPANAISTAHQDFVYTQIRIPNFVAANSQFNFNNGGYANFQTTLTPRTVTVVVSYPSAGIAGQLAPFPNPDVLHLGSSFQINASATTGLE